MAPFIPTAIPDQSSKLLSQVLQGGVAKSSSSTSVMSTSQLKPVQDVDLSSTPLAIQPVSPTLHLTLPLSKQSSLAITNEKGVKLEAERKQGTNDLNDEEDNNDNEDQGSKETDDDDDDWESIGEPITWVNLDDLYTTNDSGSTVQDIYVVNLVCEPEGELLWDHKIVGAFDSLDDANKAAQGCLENRCDCAHWKRYKERILKDGRICIRAQKNGERGHFSVDVEKTTCKRQLYTDSTKMIYVVREEERIESTEGGDGDEGELQDYKEIIFRDLESANAYARKLYGERAHDREQKSDSESGEKSEPGWDQGCSEYDGMFWGWTEDTSRGELSKINVTAKDFGVVDSR